MKTILNLSLTATSILLLSACTSSAPVLPDTTSFKQGKQDGCTTATGEYTKDGDAFKIDADYKNGWFYGRKNCHPSQA